MELELVVEATRWCVFKVKMEAVTDGMDPWWVSHYGLWVNQDMA